MLNKETFKEYILNLDTAETPIHKLGLVEPNMYVYKFIFDKGNIKDKTNYMHGFGHVSNWIFMLHVCSLPGNLVITQQHLFN